MDSATLLSSLHELQQLSPDTHLFCPREGPDDDSHFFDEDVIGQIEKEDSEDRKERHRKIKEVTTRKDKILASFQILAYDGSEAEPYKHWLTERLDNQLRCCDICIREYHRSRPQLRELLEATFDVEDVANFLRLVDNLNIQRIRAGLEKAAKNLSDAPVEKRGISCLDSNGLYAIFETLSCKAFLTDERLLQKYFDKPFEMVQMKKRLKLNGYSPAMTYFLFTLNDRRYHWAFTSWSRFRRNMTSSEFSGSVHDALDEAMKRVTLAAMDLSFLPIFWNGAKLIVGKLDEALIIHSLAGMDTDLCRLALEHLQFDSSCFTDLLQTVGELLTKAPTVFWNSMGPISPKTIIEQIFNSPSMEKILLTANLDNDSERGSLEDAFTWISPFVASIKPANQAPACRALVDQLMGRLQSDTYSRTARGYCYNVGLKVLCHTLRLLGAVQTGTQFVGNTTVADILDIIQLHIKNIVAETHDSNGRQGSHESVDLSLEVIRRAISLDCLSLAMYYDAVARGKPSPQDTDTHSSPIWEEIIKGVHTGNFMLATNALLGARSLLGLEKYVVKSTQQIPPPMKKYNDLLEKLWGFVTEILERLNSFGPEHLESILVVPESTAAIIPMLFASEQSTRQIAVEFIKCASFHDDRKEALSYILDTSYTAVLTSFFSTLQHISRKKIFAPMPSILRISTDIMDNLCDSQGLLRSRVLSKSEGKVTESFWEALWQTLTVIFEMTEEWSNSGHEKTLLMEFCRDSMQLADSAFDYHSIVAASLKKVPAETDSQLDVVHRLLQFPKIAMNGMVKWLRLRDDYLSSKSVTLISKLLVRLREVKIDVTEDSLQYVEDIVSDKTRSKLNGQQKAELEQSLETHRGYSRQLPSFDVPTRVQKQGSISQWVKNIPPGERLKDDVKPVSAAEEASEDLKRIVKDNSRAAEIYKAQLAARQTKVKTTSTPATKPAPRPAIDSGDFKRKREAEREAKKKRDALALAQAKKNIPNRGVAAETAEEGSGLQGLGVRGKDHAAKGTGMMVSSEEESEEEDEEDELDRELFGPARGPKKPSKVGSDFKKVLHDAPQMPIKKQRQIRTARDMRARLAPDLSPLHKSILSWDYFHDGDFPQDSRPDMYSAVPNSFRTPFDYQNTFQPLLLLEAWQGFVKAREESTFKPFEIKIVSRSSVDAFMEIGSTMTPAENKEIGISDGDIILLSKAKSPANSSDEPHCLARVHRINRKKAHLEVIYRVMPGNPLLSSLSPNVTVNGAKIQSITPLEREYGALLGLQYYDLCDEIIKAKPSPLLKYSDKQLDPLINNYKVNKAQAKAIKSAMDNDAFTLIQGPPGSGKTKTIVAIVGALLTDALRDRGTIIEKPKGLNGTHGVQGGAPPKKLLVCAPSNAAVDELVMRFKEGIRTLGGQHRKLSIVRLGRSDAMNTNVIDVTLDELVNAKLNAMPGGDSKQREETQKLMKEHQLISEKLREAREALDKGETKGDAAAKLKDDFDALRRRKAQLGTQIDTAKDAENMMSRQADLNRRKAQQSVLDEAHIICATLSGSGHDMFQNLNIEFESVVVDEAAQCVEMSALIPLKYGCAKCILVGDPKQLPPTVFSKEAARFQYEQSLFVRMQGNHPDDVHLLDTQYRMHPEISSFPSQTFYDGKLLDGDNMAGLRHKPWHLTELLGPYRFFDVQGQHQAAPRGHSLVNYAEIDVALSLFERLMTDFKTFDFKNKIGIITPYKSQLRELKDRFSRKYGQTILDNVEFNTTDAFQGRESEIIIFSCVRASPAGGIGFLQDIRRMNVGLTRAKSSLWVLGNSQSLGRGEFWKKLVDDARQRGRYTDGNVLQMLKAPSRAVHNAPPKAIKSEPGSRISSPISYGHDYNGKMEIGNGDEDVEMKDVFSENESSRSQTSRTSTPHSDSAKVKEREYETKDVEFKEEAHIKNGVNVKTKNGTGPSADSGNGYAPPRGPLPPKRKKPVDPFLPSNRPKKPKPE